MGNMSLRFLCFPIGNRMFPGAEPYVFHMGNVGFCLRKRKNRQEVFG